MKRPSAQAAFRHALENWAEAVHRIADRLESNPDRVVPPDLRRLQRRLQEVRRHAGGRPIPLDEAVAENVRRAIERWRAVEPIVRERLDRIRTEARACRTTRRVVHTYDGSAAPRGRTIRLVARGDGDVHSQ